MTINLAALRREKILDFNKKRKILCAENFQDIRKMLFMLEVLEDKNRGSLLFLSRPRLHTPFRLVSDILKVGQKSNGMTSYK